MTEVVEPFQLNAETEESLCALFLNDPVKLQRLKTRISQCRNTQNRIEALQKKLDIIREKNKALCKTAGLTDEEESNEVKISTDDADEFDEKTYDPESQKYPSDWWTGASAYQNKGPSIRGTVSTVLEGKLYRVLTDKGEWAFYNDSMYHEMHVLYELEKDSEITPGSCSKVNHLRNGNLEVSLILYPEQTAVLFSGIVKNFENKSEAVLLPGNYQEPENEINQTLEKNLIKIKLEAKKAGKGAVQGSQAVALCVESSMPFIDEQFFPNSRSLHREGDNLLIPPLHWRTYREFLPKEALSQVRLFTEAIHPSIVEMGEGLSDTGVISAIQVAAELPGAIRSLFYHPVGAREGKVERSLNAYRIHLCKEGWWSEIILDGYIPAGAHCPEFARVKSDLKSLWLPLLEKAFAKLYGSYSSLLVVPGETAFMNLTGAPCVPLTSLWPQASTGGGSLAVLSGAITRQFEVGGKMILHAFPLSSATTKEKKDRLEAAYKQLGLHPGYTACVLGVDQVDGILLLRIRQNYSGESGRNWLKVWNTAKKPWITQVERLVFETGEKDILWMEVSDVTQYFKGGNFIFPFEGWSDVRVKGHFESGTPSVGMKISVKQVQRCIFVLTQPDIKGGNVTLSTSDLDKMLSDDTLSPIGVHVFGSSGNEAKWLGSSGSTDIFTPSSEPRYVFTEQACLAIDLVPEKSPYFIVPRIREKNFVKKPYVLSISVESAPPSCSPSDDFSISFVSVKGNSTVFSNPSKCTNVVNEVQMVEAEYLSRWGSGRRWQSRTQAEVNTM